MLSPDRSARSRSLAGAGSLLLLACFLVSQFVATTHEFTARHTTCSRHGELIDLDARAFASTAGASPSETSTQLSTPGEAGGQSQHQHCLFVSSRRSQKDFRVVGPVASSLSAAANRTPATFTNVVHASLALYLAAPKHSPPAA